MTRQEVPEQPKRSNFWKPALFGEKKEGVFVRCETPRAGKEKFGLTYIIREPDGHETSLPNHGILCAKMALIKPGAYVWIEYKGKTGKEFTYKVEFDPDYKPQSTLNDISDPAGALIQDMKKADGWESGMFSELVMKHVNGDIGESFKLIEKLKNEGKIQQYQTGNNKPVWRVTA